MGCCASKDSVAPAPGSVAFAAAKPLASLTPEAQAAADQRGGDGAAAGAAELRAVVLRMVEFLGAAHHYTVKWQRVLEGMSGDS